MLMRLSQTVRRAGALIPLAVFFLSAAIAGAADEDQAALAGLERDLTALVSRLSESVVTVEGFHPINSYYGSANGDAVVSAVSSGVVFDSSGLILVDAASVAEFEHIQVLCAGQVCGASLIAIDYQAGLALLRTHRPIGRPVKIAHGPICTGGFVLAVGNSFGINAAPAMGICVGIRPDDRLQFTAPISSGTLGGGVFNLSGELVGVISGGLGAAGRSEAGLAVPVSDLPGIVRHLLRYGDRTAGYVGVSVTETEISPPLEIQQSAMFASVGGTQTRILDRGAVITGVVSGSPAARAGLRVGDVLVSVDGRLILSAVELMKTVRNQVPGKKVRVGLLRNGMPLFQMLEVGRLGLSRSATPQLSGDNDLQLQQEIDSLRHQLNRLEATVQQRKR